AGKPAERSSGCCAIVVPLLDRRKSPPKGYAGSDRGAPLAKRTGPTWFFRRDRKADFAAAGGEASCAAPSARSSGRWTRATFTQGGPPVRHPAFPSSPTGRPTPFHGP